MVWGRNAFYFFLCFVISVKLITVFPEPPRCKESNSDMRSWNINHPVSVEGHDGGTSQRKDGERKSVHLHSFIPPTARELIGFALFPPVLTSHYEPWFRMEPGAHIALSAGGRWLLKPDAAAAVCPSLATWSSLTATQNQLQHQDGCLESGSILFLVSSQAFKSFEEVFHEELSAVPTLPGCWQGGEGQQKRAVGEFLS